MMCYLYFVPKCADITVNPSYSDMKDGLKRVESHDGAVRGICMP